MIHDGLWCAFNNYHMGVTAENLCSKYEISREEQDEFSAWSQQKAQAAIESNRFAEEIIPVEVPGRKGQVTVFAQDEFPRAGTTSEGLGKLRPAFNNLIFFNAGFTKAFNSVSKITSPLLFPDCLQKNTMQKEIHFFPHRINYLTKPNFSVN